MLCGCEGYYSDPSSPAFSSNLPLPHYGIPVRLALSLARQGTFSHFIAKGQ